VILYGISACRLIGKNVKLEIVKDTSHVPQIENAAEFNKIIKNFLSASP
jgi:pimeloyl-ACP methyl ester carboxylesterase